jgi:hypothetical protein
MHDEPVEAAPLARLPCAVLRLRGTAVRDLSDEACRELGRARDDLIGAGFVRSLVDADRAALTAAAGGPAGAVLEVRRPVDTVTVEVFELTLAPDHDGSVLVDVRDATERHRLRRLLDRSGTSNQILDAHADTIWPLTGLGDDDLDGIHAGDLADLLAGDDLLGRPGGMQVGSVRVRWSGPRSPWVEARATAVNRLDDPRIAGIVVRSEPQAERRKVDPAR